MANYAELKLYFGNISSRGLREGRYEHEPTSPGSRAAVASARELIEQHLQWFHQNGLKHAIQISHFDYGVTHSEPEALQLIKYAEIYFPNAQGLVVPYDVLHGSLRFHRVIRFNEARWESLDDIVASMKQSEHLPFTKEQAGREFILGEEEFLKRNDQSWRAAIKFY